MKHQPLPSWLDENDESVHSAPLSNPSNLNPLHPSNSIGNNPPGSADANFLGAEDPQKKKQVIKGMLKFITMSLCILMFVTACLGLISIAGIIDIGRIFVAMYMLFSSVMLFFYELIELRKVEWIEHMIRRNFGFLFSFVGKALFIIFIAFLSFGLGSPETLSLATGISFAAFGAAEIGLYLKYPDYFE